MNEITVLAFVRELWTQLGKPELPGNSALSDDALLHYGRTHFWLEDQDQVGAGELLQRRSAARIIHQFMKNELKIPDSADIEKAKVLADLYTCRVCVEHVAQVYTKGIMDARETENDQGQIVKIFDMLGTITQNEAKKIIKSINFVQFS